MTSQIGGGAFFQPSPQAAQWRYRVEDGESIATYPGIVEATFGASTFESVTIEPTPDSDEQGLVVSQSGPTSGALPLASFYYNDILINGDNAECSNTAYGLAVRYGAGGPNLTGQRTALRAFFVLNAASSPANPYHIYAGLSGEIQASSGDGGTGVTSATALGRFIGSYASAILAAGATNIFDATGLEINTSIRATASAYNQIAIKAGKWGDSVVQATEEFCIQIGNQFGALGWKSFGIAFDQSSPGTGTCLDPAATAVGSKGAVTCTNVLDFSSATVSGAFLKCTGFEVSGAGKFVTNLTVEKASATLTLQATSGNAFHVLAGVAATLRALTVRTGSSERWRWNFADSTAESGANAGSDFSLSAYSDAAALIGTAFSIVRATMKAFFGGAVQVGGVLDFSADNTYSLASSGRRSSVVYSATGTINTSDEREKQDIGPIPDAWLDAWEDVQWHRYKWREAVATKGDGARWHVGLIAQRVQDAFARRGIDALQIGLLCYDEFEGGNRYGVRYEQAFALEAAWTRRELARLKA